MFSRLFHGLVIVFWMLAMTWLFTEKIIPLLHGGDPPDYQSDLDDPQRSDPPDAWKLRYNGQTIGYAASRIIQQGNSGLDQCSYVEFENLPLDSIVSELLGPMSAVIRPFLQESRDIDLDMLVATRMRFDHAKRLKSFDTVIDLPDYPKFLTVDGALDTNGKLELIAHLAGGSTENGREFHYSVQIPPEALVEGSLSPRTELQDLHIGQSWTMPVFRAFPPNSPVQIVHAEVEKHDIVLWENEEVETLEVVYRTDAGSGVNATRRPLSREWIRPHDGQVLRREIRFSGIEMVFERQGDSLLAPYSERLDTLDQRLWQN